MYSKINYFLEQTINNWVESRYIVKTHRVPTEDWSVDFIHKSSKSPKTTGFQRKISRVLLDRDTSDLFLKNIRFRLVRNRNFCEKNRKISMTAIVNERRGRCLRHTYKQVSHRHLFLLHGSTDKYANHTYICVIERSIDRREENFANSKVSIRMQIAFEPVFYGRSRNMFLCLRLKYVSQEECYSPRIEI